MTTALAPTAGKDPTVTIGATLSSIPAPQGRTRGTIQRRVVRLTAVPDPEPPFDDERPSLRRVERLRREPHMLVDADPGVPHDPDLVAPATAFCAAGTAAAPLVAAAVPDQSYAPDFGVRHTPSRALPDSERTAHLLGRALIETLTGLRPAAQLLQHCSPPVHAGLVQRTPLAGTGPARVQSVHVSHPADGIAEVAMIFRRGDRARAIAFRLAGIDGRWRITALQIG